MNQRVKKNFIGWGLISLIVIWALTSRPDFLPLTLLQVVAVILLACIVEVSNRKLTRVWRLTCIANVAMVISLAFNLLVNQSFWFHEKEVLTIKIAMVFIGAVIATLAAGKIRSMPEIPESRR